MFLDITNSNVYSNKYTNIDIGEKYTFEEVYLYGKHKYICLVNIFIEFAFDASLFIYHFYSFYF